MGGTHFFEVGVHHLFAVSGAVDPSEDYFFHVEISEGYVFSDVRPFVSSVGGSFVHFGAVGADVVEAIVGCHVCGVTDGGVF